ncbi:MAG: hypothetical protein SNJ73_01895 [Acetobacteraceae bacterium]
MAFTPGNLAVLSYAAGFTLWSYTSAGDLLGTILAPGYFDPAFTHLRRGDLLLVSARDTAALGLVGASSPAGVAVDVLGPEGQVELPSVPADAILDQEGYPILAEDGGMILAG